MKTVFNEVLSYILSIYDFKIGEIGLRPEFTTRKFPIYDDLLKAMSTLKNKILNSSINIKNVLARMFDVYTYIEKERKNYRLNIQTPSEENLELAESVFNRESEYDCYCDLTEIFNGDKSHFLDTHMDIERISDLTVGLIEESYYLGKVTSNLIRQSMNSSNKKKNNCAISQEYEFQKILNFEYNEKPYLDLYNFSRLLWQDRSYCEETKFENNKEFSEQVWRIFDQFLTCENKKERMILLSQIPAHLIFNKELLIDELQKIEKIPKELQTKALFEILIPVSDLLLYISKLRTIFENVIYKIEDEKIHNYIECAYILALVTKCGDRLDRSLMLNVAAIYEISKTYEKEKYEIQRKLGIWSTLPPFESQDDFERDCLDVLQCIYFQATTKKEAIEYAKVMLQFRKTVKDEKSIQILSAVIIDLYQVTEETYKEAHDLFLSENQN